ncbi:MAG: C4-dicarboxylate TRAP transporter substrate-binding protein [Paracoccaceae bacterium]
MLRSLMFATSLAAVAAGPALAETKLRVASGFPPKSAVGQSMDTYSETLNEASGGDLAAKTFNLSLLSLGETSAGLRDGIADVGYLISAYFPAEYPHYNLISELSMISSGPEGATNQGLAYSAAVAEYTLNNCPKCVEEFAAQNQVFTGSAASTRYGLLCTEQTDTVADLKGKRLRVAGSQWARWATAVGGAPVSLKINEVYEGLSQGVIDCVIISAPELINFSLVDVVKSINMFAPGGVYAGSAVANVNRDTWNALSADQRTAMMKGASSLAADVAWRYVEDEKSALATAAEKGIHISEPNAELTAATKEFVTKDAVTIAEFYKDKYGIENSAQIIEEFRPIVDKWFDLTANVSSKAELETLFWDEIYSKVDVNTYAQ